MTKPIVGAAIFVAKPGKEAALEQALLSVIEPTRAEIGVIYYDLHRDIKNPARLFFVESWESIEAHKAHEKQPHIQALFAVLPELINSSDIHFGYKL